MFKSISNFNISDENLDETISETSSYFDNKDKNFKSYLNHYSCNVDISGDQANSLEIDEILLSMRNINSNEDQLNSDLMIERYFFKSKKLDFKDSNVDDIKHFYYDNQERSMNQFKPINIDVYLNESSLNNKIYNNIDHFNNEDGIKTYHDDRVKNVT